MSMEQAILEHAAALRDLSAALNAMNAGRADALASGFKEVQGYPGVVVSADAELEEAVSKVEKAAKAESKKPVAEKAETLNASSPTGGADSSEDENLISADDKVLDYKADVVPALLALQKKTGGLKDLLTKFGVTKGDQLKAEQYADIVAQANKLAA